MTHDRVPPGVSETVDGWLGVHDEHAPGVLEGCYLVGSVALDDWRPVSDVDIVAFTADPTDAETVELLRRAHGAFRTEFDGPDVDGPVLAWADVSSPPLAAQRAWTLDGEFRFDGDCFEINPVTWYTLDRYGVAVRGPDAAELDVHLDDDDRRSWVRENVDTYWRHVRDQIVGALDADPGRREFDPAMTEWCVLGMARMAYTHDTADVASKTAAGAWAVDRFAQHASALRAAIAIRRDGASERVDRDHVTAVIAFMDAVVDHVVAG